MTQVLITWWTGLLVAFAIGLSALCLILKLRDWGIDPLRVLDEFVRRPRFERLLLLFFVCGMVQYASTKGTGSGSRSSDSGARGGDASRIETEIPRGESIPQTAEVTNFCFTGIAVLTNGVELTLAWPTNFFVGGTTLDFFARYYSITNAWSWFAYCQTSPGMTNVTVAATWQDDLGCVTNPSAMFFKVQDRTTCAVTMTDSDGDGLPNVYELHNGTNPYVPDYAAASKLTVGSNGDYASIESALADSEPYSLISLSGEEWSLNEPLRMPDHPVMMIGPADRPAIIRSVASIGAVLLDRGQDSRTLFRNLYLVLERQGNFQSGFWIGGNLPWSGLGASPSFENIRIRALYPDTLYYGWHFYRDNGDSSVISNCVMNAANATAAIGVYVYDGPSASVEASSFINFPTNGDSFAAYFRQESNVVAQAAVADANLTWAGYPRSAVYSTTSDADGDGLSDYDEIHVYDTDPLLADSDGDGVADNAEIESSSNPHDVSSFKTIVRIAITNTVIYAGVTNYAYIGSVPRISTELLVCSGSGYATGIVFDVSASIADMCVYRDLNRNGQYDEEYDILLTKLCSGAYSSLNASFSFGDVDGDGVSDLDERSQETDPYSAKSYRVSKNIQIKDADSSSGITNYYRFSASTNMTEAFLSGRFCASAANVNVQASATNGCLYLSVYRDLNRNGVYDEGIDGRVVKTINNLSSGPINIGDSDGDGVNDSHELNDNTNPLDGRNYRLEAVVFYESLDGDGTITNYIQLSPNLPTWEDRGASWFAGHFSTNMSVRGIVTNAYFYANAFRDVNCNGRLDPGIDLFKSSRLGSWNNHRENGLLIGDCDSDGVCDSEELEFGTDPTNILSYGFNLDLTMGGIFSTSNILTGVVLFGGHEIVEPFAATSHVFTCRLTNLVTQTGETVDVVLWDDLDGNGVRDSNEMSTSQRIYVDGTNTVVYCRMPLGPFDSDNDGMLDNWEINNGMSPVDASDALNDEDVDGLINLHEYMADCDPHVPDGTTTALYAFNHLIDERVSDDTKTKLTYSSGWIRNTNCWTFGLDTTCASPYNSSDTIWRAGTAITRRHIAYAQHFKLSHGATVRFVGMDNAVHERALQNSIDLVDTDITIGLLSSDLPDAVLPASLLPDNYSLYIGDARRLPMLMFDQIENSIVTDSNSLGYGVQSADGLVPVDTSRRHFFEDVIYGDSGDPKFFVTNLGPVLITTLTSYGTGNSGVGPNLVYYKSRIQAAVDALCPGYSLREIDIGTLGRNRWK